MPLATNAAVQDRTFSSAEEVEAIAADLLQGLQYSLVSAAAHPEIRLPFGSLEEAFQEAIGIRPAEQRWVYHARARRIALGSPAARQAAFGRYGMFGAEEFACGGLEIVHRHLSEQRSILRSRRDDDRFVLGPASSAGPRVVPHPGPPHHRRRLHRPGGARARPATRSP